MISGHSTLDIFLTPMGELSAPFFSPQRLAWVWTDFCLVNRLRCEMKATPVFSLQLTAKRWMCYRPLVPWENSCTVTKTLSHPATRRQFASSLLLVTTDVSPGSRKWCYLPFWEPAKREEATGGENAGLFFFWQKKRKKEAKGEAGLSSPRAPHQRKTKRKGGFFFFFYLQHVRDLGPLLRRVLRLNEQLLQQRLLVELTHQFTLQMLFHVVHQEVHHRLGHTEDANVSRKDVRGLLCGIKGTRRSRFVPVNKITKWFSNVFSSSRKWPAGHAASIVK